MRKGLKVAASFRGGLDDRSESSEGGAVTVSGVKGVLRRGKRISVPLGKEFPTADNAGATS